MISEIDSGQWGILILGALLVGLAKGGIPGVGNLTVAIFAMIFPARLSAGILLPTLICSDIVAVLVYRKHAAWDHMGKLVPWTAAGIAVGYFMLDKISDTHVQLMGMTAVHFYRKSKVAEAKASGIADPFPHSLPFVATTGVLAGFATMVANAAGPVASLYLLAVGLPKYAFIGTMAWFWFLANVIKVPLQISLGNIDTDTIQVSLLLGIPAALGALIAPKIVRFIKQDLFEVLVWFFIILAGLRLLYSGITQLI